MKRCYRGTFQNVKDLIKWSVGTVFFYSGLFHVVRFVNNLLGRRLTIVTYHRVAVNNDVTMRSSNPALVTSQRTFEQQLRFLSRWYKIITFSDLRHYMKDNTLPKNALIITFDDGYSDNYLGAYPVLNRMRLKATIFIVAEKVGDGNGKPFWWDRAFFYFGEILKKEKDVGFEPGEDISDLLERFQDAPGQTISEIKQWKKETIENFFDTLQEKYAISEAAFREENRTLSLEEMNRMNGDIEFGSHTCSHHNLVLLSEGERDYEINESKRILEKMASKEVIAFSYPYGYMNDEIETMVKKAGYQFAVTTCKGVNDMSDPCALKRISVGEGLSLWGRFSQGFFAYKLMGF